VANAVLERQNGASEDQKGRTLLFFGDRPGCNGKEPGGRRFWRKPTPDADGRGV